MPRAYVPRASDERTEPEAEFKTEAVDSQRAKVSYSGTQYEEGTKQGSNMRDE